MDARLGMMRHAFPTLAVAVLLGCGPELSYDQLVGRWAYEECALGGEGVRNIPCEDFRGIGKVELRPDSTVAYVLDGGAVLYSGRIEEMEFSGMSGELRGRASGTDSEAEVSIRIQEGRLIYRIRFRARTGEGPREIEENAVLRKE
jgi:hypothetical protein